jgi:radical SAM protein with 4Fe4S-binding SPASM domain
MPVEYAVETTARCNLLCPMCPREQRQHPNQDMPDSVFETVLRESGGAAELIMLMGFGEPLLDRKIFQRIEYCARHNLSTLISTNGTLLDEKAARQLLESPLREITLAFDGAGKETFELYRKGARFETVRDNFVRFARLKHELRPDMQVVVQMILMERNTSEVDEFRRFWSAVPGVDQVRIKPLETHGTGQGDPEWQHRCHHLWRGPAIVGYNGDVYPCCTSYSIGGAPAGRLGDKSLPEVWNSERMQHARRLHSIGRGREVDWCTNCSVMLPHPVLAAGSLVLPTDAFRKVLISTEQLVLQSRVLGRLVRSMRDVPSIRPPKGPKGRRAPRRQE